jgi:NADH-quinone oxidoreductase subunit J
MEDNASVGFGQYDSDGCGRINFANEVGVNMENSILFYILSGLIVLSAFLMVVVVNPIYSSLFLVMAMVAISGIFYLLEAYFIAGVQLIVYAGAVMVLFVMVLMLFDLKRELMAFSRGIFSGFLKLTSAGAILGLVFGAAERSTEMMKSPSVSSSVAASGYSSEMKQLTQILFSEYLLEFEILGVLLLLIAVGVVAVSRSKGGTHART